MAKKAYQLAGTHSHLIATVNSLGKQVELSPDDDTYETSDPEEQSELDYLVAMAGSGLKKAEKGAK